MTDNADNTDKTNSIAASPLQQLFERTRQARAAFLKDAAVGEPTRKSCNAVLTRWAREVAEAQEVETILRTATYVWPGDIIEVRLAPTKEDDRSLVLVRVTCTHNEKHEVTSYLLSWLLPEALSDGQFRTGSLTPPPGREKEVPFDRLLDLLGLWISDPIVQRYLNHRRTHTRLSSTTATTQKASP